VTQWYPRKHDELKRPVDNESYSSVSIDCISRFNKHSRNCVGMRRITGKISE